MKPSNRKRKKALKRIERGERVLLLLEALAEKAGGGVPILVEGKRDVEALRRLGVEGSIVGVKASRVSLKEAVERLPGKPGEIILLMDFDRAGVKLTSTLARRLEAGGFHPNLEFWLKLKSLLGREVKDVEGLASYLENVKREVCL